MTAKVSSRDFLTDVITLAFSAFGGPQAHVAMLFERMVEKRKYITEEELIELNALCQILPGPTSTQTITALGYKLGGVRLAFATLLIWLLPAAIGMITIAVTFRYLQDNHQSLEFAKYIKAMAIGFICFAAFKLGKKILKEKLQWGIAIATLAITTSILVLLEKSFLTAIIFPLLLILGGTISASIKKAEKEPLPKLQIKWTYLVLFAIILIGLIIASQISTNSNIILLDQFYRNGSMIFGGGDVLIPFLQSWFVESTQLLTQEEFLTGYGMVRAMPGPMFSFCGYLGAMSSSSPILGGLIGIVGVFLPGTLLIFFLVDFWDELKKFSIVKNSLNGITAVSVGLISSAAISLIIYLAENQIGSALWIDFGISIATFLLLSFTKIPAPVLILVGLGAGFVF